MSPFGYGRGEGVDAGHGDPEWICSREKPRYDSMFQGLNPVDGKVTGAGTCPPQPPDPAWRALLAATDQCSLLAQLCGTLQHSPQLPRLADALALSTQNCTMIAQYLVSERSEAMSSGVSIHSLPQSSRFSSYAPSRPDSPVTEPVASDSSDTSEEESAPMYNLDLKEEKSNFFQPIVQSITFIFLLLLNIVTISITIEIMFLTVAYVLTGEPFLEFVVERTPQSWLEASKVLAFGPEEELVRIDSFFGIFTRSNFDKVLKRILSALASAVSS